MRLQNTSTIPTAVVREVIRFVMPPGVTRASIAVTRTYPNGWRGHGGGRRVLVRIPKAMPARGAVAWPARGGYLGSPRMGSLVETLVFLLAHELRHCWQTSVPRGRRVWGARGQYSERDADAYAINALRRWRREHPMGGKR